MEARERVLGGEHPDTLTIVNNLAFLLFRKGDYAGAQPLYKQALRASERVLGAEHPDTLGSVNNLALLLQSQGDYAGAQTLYERAIEARERVLGSEHPDTLQSVNNLATLLLSQGVYSAAQPLLERALEARERVLGADHPSTLVSVNNLASLLHHKGDYAGAQPLLEQALEARRRVLGAEHPDTLTSVNNLAGLLESKGDYAGAQPLYERALKASERVLGAEHPDTLGSVNNLAFLLESKGDYAGAQPLYERALEGLLKISQTIQRPHPNLEASVGNYASCLEKLGRSPEQIRNTLEELGRPYGQDLTGLGEGVGNKPSAKLRPVLDEIMRDQSKIQEIGDRLQREDPGLFMELVAFLQSQQFTKAAASPTDYVEALRKAMTEREHEFGPNDPMTIAALNDLAKHLESMDAFDEAETEYRKALERAPGDMIVLGNYAFFLQNFRRDFPGAEQLYARALAADPTDAINHTNCGGLCLVMGKFPEAATHLSQARRLMAGQADGYTARTLFLRSALAALRNEDSTLYTGQLKTLFDQNIQPEPSRNLAVRDHLQQNLSAEHFTWFDALYAAINEPDGIARLSTLPAWQAIPPRPLEEAWPGE